jgi:Glycosyl transferase family 11
MDEAYGRTRNRMITIRLQGGLGNQMFQYAAGLALATQWNVGFSLDLRFLLDRSPRLKHVFRDFDLPVFPAATYVLASESECRPLMGSYPASGYDRLRKRLGGFSRWISQVDAPAPILGLGQIKPPYYLDGYWQSEDYFAVVQDEVRRRFSLPEPALPASRELAMEIAGAPSVMLNVRRGDYVAHAGSANCHGFCGLAYYERAIALIRRVQPDAPIYVFSDEIEWCRDNLRIMDPVFYVGHQHAGERFRDYLRLMTHCQYFIIPNSSFAWWAAWLGARPGKLVLCPRQWFNDAASEARSRDVVPNGWIRI